LVGVTSSPFSPCWLPVFCSLIFWFSSVAKSHVFKWKSKWFVGSMQSFKLNLDFVHVNSTLILIEIHINSSYCWFKPHCFSVRLLCLLVVCWWHAPLLLKFPLKPQDLTSGAVGLWSMWFLRCDEWKTPTKSMGFKQRTVCQCLPKNGVYHGIPSIFFASHWGSRFSLNKHQILGYMSHSDLGRWMDSNRQGGLSHVWVLVPKTDRVAYHPGFLWFLLFFLPSGKWMICSPWYFFSPFFKANFHRSLGWWKTPWD
jgi:hypothetical protein